VGLSEDQKAMLRLLAQREEGYEDIGALMGLSVGEVRAKVRGAVEALQGDGPGPAGEDQRAMLRLLAQREEGYEDIGALMGLSVDEVRARVKDALAELEGSGDAPAPSPPSPPEAARAPEPPPEPRPVEPEPAAPRRGPARTAQRATPRAIPAKSLLGNKRLLAQVGGCALILILLILFATGAIDIGGGGGGDEGSSGSESTPAAVNPTSTSKVPTQAVLSGVEGSEAEGRAIFGRLKSQVLLVVAAKGLAPTPSGSSYAISLARSPSERIPIAATKVGKSGTISGQFQVPATALGLLAGGFDEMEVSLVPNGELRVAVTEAQKQKKTPQFGGTDVLRGPVTGPVVEKAEEEG
jgi:hypothetical protein